MSFNKDGFMEFIDAEFSYNGSTKRIIDNSIMWAVENLEENEISNYIFNILNEPTLEEIKQFDNFYNLKSTKIEEIKRAFINYYNYEFGENYKYEDFDKLCPDIEHIGVAYTTTEDQNHEIQFEINLKEYTWTQYVDNEPITKASYIEMANGDKNKALDFLKDDLLLGDFDAFVSVDEKDLKEKLGLEIDDDGNFYNPNKKYTLFKEGKKMESEVCEKAEKLPMLEDLCHAWENVSEKYILLEEDKENNKVTTYTLTPIYYSDDRFIANHIDLNEQEQISYEEYSKNPNEISFKVKSQSKAKNIEYEI